MNHSKEDCVTCDEKKTCPITKLVGECDAAYAKGIDVLAQHTYECLNTEKNQDLHAVCIGCSLEKIGFNNEDDVRRFLKIVRDNSKDLVHTNQVVEICFGTWVEKVMNRALGVTQNIADLIGIKTSIQFMDANQMQEMSAGRTLH